MLTLSHNPAFFKQWALCSRAILQAFLLPTLSAYQLEQTETEAKPLPALLRARPGAMESVPGLEASAPILSPRVLFPESCSFLRM